MNELKKLKDELSKVLSRTIPLFINHEEIANSNGISANYARQIRCGEYPIYNTSENRVLLQRLINAYRKEIRIKNK